MRYEVQQTECFCNCGQFFALLNSPRPPAPPAPLLAPPPNSPKNKTLKKKRKKHQEISSFYTIVPKIMIICYTVPEMRCVMDVIAIFHFGLYFSLLPS